MLGTLAIEETNKKVSEKIVDELDWLENSLFIYEKALKVMLEYNIEEKVIEYKEVINDLNFKISQ